MNLPKVSGKVESIPLTTIHRITIMKIVYLWHPKSDFYSDNKNGVRINKSGFISVHPKLFLFLDAARCYAHVEN